MNILFHMYLSNDDPELLVGNFMGDFVKGLLGNSYPPRVRQGLELHRRIDSFAQINAAFKSSRVRLPERYGLYRGVLVDLFYDHFLAKEWSSWSVTPLDEYLCWARAIIDEYQPIMSTQLQGFIPVMFDQLLPSYSSVAGIESALTRMSRRIKRANPLAEGGGELALHYSELHEDFEKFIITAKQFANDFIENGGMK